MRVGRRDFAALLLLLVAVASIPQDARGDTNPPVIERVWWEPRFPIYPDNVTLFARVSDPDGLQLVESVFCYVPPFLCLYDTMSDPDADGVWTIVPRGPGGTSTQPAAMAKGASVGVSAVDTFNNGAVSAKQYVLFVDALNLSFAAPVIEVEPGQPFTVWGSAFYEDNITAPAEGVSVDVAVSTESDTALVAADGAFSVTLTAPSAEGTYTITARSTDRSLSDVEESSLAVTTIPRADVTISDVRVSPQRPVIGPVSISFHARNIGTAAATDARIVVAIAGPVNATILDERYSIPALGGDLPLEATWTAPVGSYLVHVAIDPDDELDELDEGNNAIDSSVSVTPPPELTISDVRVSPIAPVVGPISVSFHARNLGEEPVTDARVLVEVIGPMSSTILDARYSIPARGGDIPLMASWDATAGRFTVRIRVDPDDEFRELDEANNVIDYTISVLVAPPAGGLGLVWIGVAGILAAVVAVIGLALIRARRAPLSRKVIAALSVLIAGMLVVAGALAFFGTPSAARAPEYRVVDIDGNALNSTDLRGDVVLIEFSGTWCEPCRIVENAFKEIFPSYSDRVVFLSVFIPPLNNQSALELHRQDRDIPLGWHLAPDSDAMQTKFGVATLPRLFVVDRNGFVTLNWGPTAIFSEETVKGVVMPALDGSLAGTASAVSVSSLGVPALMVLAALLSFFSPCSFPVLPAFMAYYLNLDAKGTKAGPKVAAGRGFLASLGMVAVYGIIALVVLTAGLAARNLQYISPAIGVVLIVAAILSLLPFQYHYLTRPFIALKQRIAARLGGRWTPGMGSKLFAFGAGYAAAGFACVAPPLIGAMSAASTVGRPEEAVLGIVLYALIVIGLMMAVTVALTVAGDRAIRKVRVWSGVMKYVSATALLIAGIYLLYLFYVSSVG